MLDTHGPLPPLNEIGERLWQPNQRIGRKWPSLARKLGPQYIVSTSVARESPNIGVRERTLVEPLLPSSDRCH